MAAGHWECAPALALVHPRGLHRPELRAGPQFALPVTDTRTVETSSGHGPSHHASEEDAPILRDLVIHYRAVIETPIVPDDQIPELPLVAESEPGLGGEIQQLLDQRPSLRLRHSDNGLGIHSYKQASDTRFRMRSHEGTNDRRRRSPLFLGKDLAHVRHRVLEVVFDLEAFDSLLGVRWKCQRRVVRLVAVPIVVGVDMRLLRRLPISMEVGHGVDVIQHAAIRTPNGVHLDGTEALGEGMNLHGRKSLATKNQQLVVEKRAANLREYRVGQWSAQVDIIDLGTHDSRERGYALWNNIRVREVRGATMTNVYATEYGFAATHDVPIPYLPRIREYYHMLGYGVPYEWAHYAEVRAMLESC
jgi:hypothetical protein